jgi:hypothetical protein
MNGIIYCIKNLINNKCYIGQSNKSFNRRYSHGRWWEETHNNALKNEVKHYGLDKFKVEILHNNVQTIDELNYLEVKEAEKYNCYWPNGYNFARCGNNKSMHEETKKKLSKAHEKRKEPIRLKEISTGKIIEIYNLSKFCKDQKLNRGNLIKMIYNKPGETIHLESQGFCLPETTLNDLKSVTMNKYTYDFYTFFHNNGEEITTTVKIFCKKFNLKRKYIGNLINGRARSVAGWSLDRQNLKNNRYKYKKLYFNKNNQKIYVEILNDFCIENNLDFSCMLKVIKGKIKFHKGYTFLGYSSSDSK